MARRSHPASKVRGGSREEPPQAQGQGQWPGRATPRPEPRVVARRSNPTSEERWLCRHRRAERSYCMFKVMRGSHEEIPLFQGKRNPSKTVGVARGHQKADILKP